MPIDLNHTIVGSTDALASATWVAQILGLEPPHRFGPFWEVVTANGVTLAFQDWTEQTTWQHYAFLISEEEFDAVFARITEQGVDYFADPGAQQKGQINTHDGGRGMYFADPDGHWLEVITRPYGSGS